MLDWLRRSLIAAGLAALALVPAHAEEGSQLTIANNAVVVPVWFDPGFALGQYNAYSMLYAMHDALVKPMPDEPLAPSLAESWTVSEDGLVYEFKLRQGTTFHNGAPVTSEDVKFSYERYNAPENAPIKTRVAAVETPSPDVVRFVLHDPWPDFMTHYGGLVTSAGWIVPKAYVEEVGDEGFAKHPIGAGPYKFVSFTPGVEIVFEAYEGYWRKQPDVKRLVIRSVPDATTRYAMLSRGDADIAYVMSGLLAEQVTATEGLNIESADSTAALWLTLTEQFDPDSPWSNIKVREAANIAIDRQALNEALYLGRGKPMGSLMMSGWQFAWEAPQFDHDPERARQLLEEAGYPDGIDGGVMFADQVYTPFAEAIANDLAAVGIRLEVRPLERASYFSQYWEKKLRGVILSAVAGFGNAATWMQEFVPSGGRYVYETYPEFDELFQKQAVEPDVRKRAELLAELQQAIREKMMFVPVIEILSIHGTGPRVEYSSIGKIKGLTYVVPYEDVVLGE